MASMQGRHLLDGSGIDNPALDLGPHPNHHQPTHQHLSSTNSATMYTSNNGNGNKTSSNSSGYFPDSTSLNSQSLSLSSSNTDSLDTVIYKM